MNDLAGHFAGSELLPNTQALPSDCEELAEHVEHRVTIALNRTPEVLERRQCCHMHITPKRQDRRAI
jgi:hypothetical protein